MYFYIDINNTEKFTLDRKLDFEWYNRVSEEEYNKSDAQVINMKSNLANQKINELKQKLYETDYQAIKYAEGVITEEEYAPMKAQRQEWRDEINNLEQQLYKAV